MIAVSMQKDCVGAEKGGYPAMAFFSSLAFEGTALLMLSRRRLGMTKSVESSRSRAILFLHSNMPGHQELSQGGKLVGSRVATCVLPLAHLPPFPSHNLLPRQLNQWQAGETIGAESCVPGAKAAVKISRHAL